MKNLLLLALAVLALTACGNRKTKAAEQTETTTVEAVEATTVNVYYFHVKQRCKTCIAVGKVAKETVAEVYVDNPNVRFVELQIDDKANAPLVEKYEVAWNALIIARGDDHVEITKQAFANALNSPDALAELIEAEVGKRL